MSEDRTQAPSKRRRLLARERGQAAHSPELTAAGGLLVATAVLWLQGDALVAALLDAFRVPLLAGSWVVQADPAEVIARVRETAALVAWPLVPVLLGFLVGATAAHQAQVQGLWAPALLAPDVSRLWSLGNGPGLSTRAGRGVWTLARSLLVAAVAFWMVYSGWNRLAALGGLRGSELVRAAASTVRQLLLTLSAATLLLGALDAFIQFRRFEAMLRVTPEEHREDLRSSDGDPALRNRRRRVSQARLSRRESSPSP
ncbi:MAG: EscU/YscU/HrcU family type III secretion system export apparatus switch protein [Isosphaeraceae bacterium]